MDEIVTNSSDQLVYVGNVPGANHSSQGGYVLMQGGTLDGKMTILAENDIYIYDHLYYANCLLYTSPSPRDRG